MKRYYSSHIYDERRSSASFFQHSSPSVCDREDVKQKMSQSGLAGNDSDTGNSIPAQEISSVCLKVESDIRVIH